MLKRKLGKSDVEAAPWALGTNVFGWTIDEAASFKILDAFTEAGFNLVDTADVYSRWKEGNQGGESESIIGRWLKSSGKRDRIVLATKVGSDMGQGKTLRKGYILTAVEDSLRRLHTDYIDLYQSHFDDLTTPVEETLEAYAELIKAGKVRIIGASNFTSQRLEQAMKASDELGLPRYETLQPLYNLYSREEFEKDLLPVCEKHQLSVIPYYGLASGFLTGKYRSEADLSKSPRGGGVKKYMNPKGMAILKALDEAAEKYNATPGAIALAWLMHQPTVAAPIASVTTMQQFNEIAKAVEIELDDDTLEALDGASVSINS